MAAKPGEENVATLYGDIHYYYAPPSQKPPHHRFDKASYVYLFENASERRARVEIANNAGTDDQDAFEGCKDAPATFSPGPQTKHFFAVGPPSR
ncbi:hypothetical protein VUR80DRAFT_641 [Thermomyces stellatus]